jgi:hypothetical protein
MLERLSSQELRDRIARAKCEDYAEEVNLVKYRLREAVRERAAAREKERAPAREKAAAGERAGWEGEEVVGGQVKVREKSCGMREGEGCPAKVKYLLLREVSEERRVKGCQDRVSKVFSLVHFCGLGGFRKIGV